MAHRVSTLRGACVVAALRKGWHFPFTAWWIIWRYARFGVQRGEVVFHAASYWIVYSSNLRTGTITLASHYIGFTTVPELPPPWHPDTRTPPCLKPFYWCMRFLKCYPTIEDALAVAENTDEGSAVLGIVVLCDLRHMWRAMLQRQDEEEGGQAVVTLQMWAILLGNIPCLQFSLLCCPESTTSLDWLGWDGSLMHCAMRGGNPQVVKLLVERAPDLLTDVYSLAKIAFQRGTALALREMLLAAARELDIWDALTSDDILLHAIRGDHADCLRVVDEICPRALENLVGKGRSLLCYAIKYHARACVRVLRQVCPHQDTGVLVALAAKCGFRE